MTEQKFTSDIVIGIECHVELKTKTKMFCACSRSPENKEKQEEPNTRTCPICLGHPGSKPVLNKEALNMSLKLALALNCNIAEELIFSRKSYFYPDMAKNYQISQFEIPLGEKGKIKLSNGKEIGITRVHMEEDPASLTHPGGMHNSSYVLIDYNRSGDPLCEIVTEPDLTSPDEARDFMKKLLTILNYLEIFDIDDCIIKADANISIKESGYVRAEIKNVTGFKEIERALNYELQRQKQAVKEKKTLVQETRLWDAEKGITRSMRTKETSEDYGYIIDPDLVKITITENMIKETKDNLPELPDEKIKKFIEKYKIDEENAKIIANEKNLAKLLEETGDKVDPKLSSKWIRREIIRVANYNEVPLSNIPISSKDLIDLLTLIKSKKITDKVGKDILEKLFNEKFDVNDFVQKNSLETVSDSKEIEKIVKEAIDENPKAVEDIKNGNEKSKNFIVGQVMRKSKGKASPDEIHKILNKIFN